jgi:hypothetical protein
LKEDGAVPNNAQTTLKDYEYVADAPQLFHVSPVRPGRGTAAARGCASDGQSREILEVIVVFESFGSGERFELYSAYQIRLPAVPAIPL